MAILLNHFSNPIDEHPDISIGVKFPLNKVNFFKNTTTTKEQVRTNLLNLLLTEPGERPFQPNYGIGLASELFKQEGGAPGENAFSVADIKQRVNTGIQTYVPEISLIDVEGVFIEHQHKLMIKITYKFNLDGTLDAIAVS